MGSIFNNKIPNYKIKESYAIDLFGIKTYLSYKSSSFKISKESYQKNWSGYYISGFINNKYTVRFSLDNKGIYYPSCSCGKCDDKLCLHVAQLFFSCVEVVDKIPDLNINDYYLNLLKDTSYKKTELIDVQYLINMDYDGELYIKIKIGGKKKYFITNKLQSFYNSYNRKTSFSLSKNFEFDPNIHKISPEDLPSFEYLLNKPNYDYSIDKAGIHITKNEFKFFLNTLYKKPIYIYQTKDIIEKIEDGFPFDINLESLENDLFNFNFNINDIEFFNRKQGLIYNDSILYYVPENMLSFINDMSNNEVSNLTLNKENALIFSKKIQPLVKDSFKMPEKLEDEFKLINPEAIFYFDFKSVIEAKVILKYGKKEFNFFEDKKTFNNELYEGSIIDILSNHGFDVIKNKFVMEDIDKMVDFIETGIYNLQNDFTVYTTEKFDKASVVKEHNIKSQFSIGKDNIMNYEFDLGNISPKELQKVFKNIENKKRYYKLRNGKILDTNTKELNELKEVLDNLNIEDYETSGVIPKYRALYLDSVKDYSIVQTNNLFDEFIRNFNKNKEGKIFLSKKDANILRDYQVTGVKWLYNIYKCGFGGILADEMGLGKTIQTIMFIKNVLKENPDAKILIVAPTSLIYNWEHEFDMFGSELKYKVIANNKDKRVNDLSTDNNIFITTYGLLRQDQEVYQDMTFELTIIDEAQNIKNPKAGISLALKKINSISKIALTGTPVENSVIEVWSIFDFLMPGYLNTLPNFQSRYNIKDMGSDAREILSNLTKMISPFILRRKKKDVLTDLPDKFENNMYIDLLPEQKTFYAAQVKKSKEEYEELLETEGFLKARFKILQLLTKLRQLCVDPKIVYPDFKGESVKMVEIINIINEYVENGHKVLIFTSFKTALDNLSSRLTENGITYYTIDGGVSSKNRTMLVDAFNKDNTNVFIITLKSGGTGLNLTSADVVIHLDLWWNPQAENQATDRAHRIGQKNKVEVLKLICKGTIEEKIIELQEKKKILSDALLETEDASKSIVSKLDESDIKELFSLSDS